MKNTNLIVLKNVASAVILIFLPIVLDAIIRTVKILVGIQNEKKKIKEKTKSKMSITA